MRGCFSLLLNQGVNFRNEYGDDGKPQYKLLVLKWDPRAERRLRFTGNSKRRRRTSLGTAADTIRRMHTASYSHIHVHVPTYPPTHVFAHSLSLHSAYSVLPGVDTCLADRTLTDGSGATRGDRILGLSRYHCTTDLLLPRHKTMETRIQTSHAQIMSHYSFSLP